MQWLCLVVLALASVAWSDDRAVYEVNIDGVFDEIEIKAPVTVEVQQADQASVWVNTPRLLRNNLVMQQHGKRLLIAWKVDDRWLNMVDSESIKVKIQLPQLRVLTSKGSGTVYLGDMQLQDFTYNNSGSGDAHMSSVRAQNISIAMQGNGDLEAVLWSADRLSIASMGSSDIWLAKLMAKDVSINSAGSGDLDIIDTSSADSVEISLMGSGDIDATQLHAVSASVKILGSGDILITVDESISATVLGSGDVKYGGTPNAVSVSQIGSGDVSALEGDES